MPPLRHTRLFGFLVGCAIILAKPCLPSTTDRSELAAAEEVTSMAPINQAEDGQLRIICFGAHPDDCELKPVEWPRSGLRKVIT